jgi:hypothetical protein
MNPETPRPPTLAGQRAGTSKGLGGTFDPQTSETPNRQQDSRNALPVNTEAVTQHVRASKQDTDRLAAAMREAVACAIAIDGVRALECSKLAAAYHEAGHCVVHALQRNLPARASIWPIWEFGQCLWIGRTYGIPKWHVDGGTLVEADLKQAQAQLAGVVAEALFGADYRLASSLDEIVIAQSIVRTVAIKIRRDPEVVWLRTLAEVASRLKAHERLVHEIADELMRKGRIKARRLGRFLQTVGSADD